MQAMPSRARRILAACLAVAGALLLTAAPSGATVSKRVVGGNVTPITEAPWQVAIVRSNVANAYYAQFCGGVIVDALHVITAAHCLDIDPTTPGPDGVVDTPTGANGRDVVAGTADLGSALPASAQRIQIASWAVMPQYDLISGNVSPYDAALATLSAPLDTSQPGIKPAVLTGSGATTAPGTPTRVSGWGSTATLPYGSTLLQSTDLLTVSDADCQSFYPAELDAVGRATMICAIAPGKDACNGDSGGPLTLVDGTLVGLVSWGPNTCASTDGSPGVYTELAEPTIAAFIRAFTPGPAYLPPQSTAAPTVTGTATYGEQLTCHPGTWSSTAPGSPEVDYRFTTTTGLTLQSWSASPTYLLTGGDGGRQVLCTERARDASGASVASSTPTDAVIGPPAPPAPTPTPTPIPTLADPSPVDTVAPRATVLSVRCAARRCVVRVRATDTGATTAGVRSVRVTLLPPRGGPRTVSARRFPGAVYEAVFRRVRRGTAWFTVAVRDLAGNPGRSAIRRAVVR
jgi:hypothetical protein